MSFQTIYSINYAHTQWCFAFFLKKNDYLGLRKFFFRWMVCLRSRPVLLFVSSKFSIFSCKRILTHWTTVLPSPWRVKWRLDVMKFFEWLYQHVFFLGKVGNIVAETLLRKHYAFYQCFPVCPARETLLRKQNLLLRKQKCFTTNWNTVSVVQWSDHSPFTSKALSSIPRKVHLNVDSNLVLMRKEYSQRSAESRGFSPGTLVSSHRESWQDGLGNTGRQ